MKKLIISLSVTLILFTALYFLFEEKIIQPTNGPIRNIIGRYREKEYDDSLNAMEVGFERFLSMQLRKMEYTAQKILGENVQKKSAVREIDAILNDYLAANPYCRRVRIVNSGLEIVYSTMKNDRRGSKLNADLYGTIFTELGAGKSPLMVDPVIENIVFYGPIGGASGGRYRILFYYAQGVLDTVFKEIGSLSYTGFLITTGKVLLVNFPEIDESDENNLAGMVSLMSESNSGAVRVSLRGYDKIVYYRKAEGEFSDWTIGLTVDSERIRISRVGAVILIMQALAVLSLIIFLLISLRQRRGPAAVHGGAGPGAVPRTPETAPAEQAAVSGLQGEAPAEERRAPQPVSAAVERSDREEQGTSSAPSGILSLSDVEEVSVVEEIGEAEVAEEVEEAEEPEPAGQAPEASASVDEVQAVEIGTPGQVEEAEPLTLSQDEELDGMLMEVSDEIGETAEGAEMPRGEEYDEVSVVGSVQSYPTVDEIERKAGEHGRISMELGAGDEDEPIEDAEEIHDQIEDDLNDLLSNQGEPKDYLPELEKLVMAGFTDSDTLDTTDERPPTISEDVFKEKEKVERDDEISKLITTIENPPVDIEGTFSDSLREMGVLKGALLLQDSAGRFLPAVSHGFSEHTKALLVFSGKERYLKEILQKGRMLHVVDNPFHSADIRNRFEKKDIEGVSRLFFAPVLVARTMRGIILLCLTGEAEDMSEMIEKVNKIKSIITKLL